VRFTDLREQLLNIFIESMQLDKESKGAAAVEIGNGDI
jgi:hypothetical protein